MKKTALICEKQKCTACAACFDSCPKHAISFQKDKLGAIYPVISYDLCVACNKCVQICPSNADQAQAPFYAPRKAYVAYNRDETKRLASASGGVAAALYQLARDQGWYSTGVAWETSVDAVMSVVEPGQTYDKFCNSKYVYAQTMGIYQKIKTLLREEKTVLMIGLPCQIAAAKSVVGNNKASDNFITCELICHGVAPAEYLKKHIQHIEQTRGKEMSHIFFRDPAFGTQKFVFSAYDDQNLQYHRRVNSDDAYQQGYHRALIYRENCYQCSYARPERIADITIGDFSGLGTSAEYSGEKINISCILVNTDRGEQLREKLAHYIEAIERPLEEALLHEKQLQHPSIKHSGREVFEQVYSESNDFEDAVRVAMQKEMQRGKVRRVLHLDELKDALRPLVKILRGR